MADSWGPVRVITAAKELHGQQWVKPLYDAMGTRFHLGGQKDRSVVIAEARPRWACRRRWPSTPAPTSTTPR